MSALLFLTVCTTRQLPQAITLGDSIRTFHPEASFVIGLADADEPLAGNSLPYPILPVRSLYSPSLLTQLAGQYTPTEFAGAAKPAFIRAAYAQYPATQQIIYLDPNSLLYAPLKPVTEQLEQANVLLTPFLSTPPTDGALPDEKYLQNIGLFNADFLAIKRSGETERMLSWWEERVQSRAYIDFCESLCLDQIWLMHVPALFDGVRIIADTAWHRGLWNWHQHPDGSPLWMNFKGLYNRKEGFFPYQTRIRPEQTSSIQQRLSAYRQAVGAHQQPVFNRAPAYGAKPEPPVVFGWRRQVIKGLRNLTQRINTVPLPVWK